MQFSVICAIVGLWAAAAIQAATKNDPSGATKYYGKVGPAGKYPLTALPNVTQVGAAHFRQARTCAVCFVGQLRGLSSTAQEIRSKFLEPIASEGVLVDVFVAAEKGDPDTIAAFGFPYGGSNLQIKLRDSTWREHQNASEIEKIVLSKAPLQAVNHYRRFPGSWIGPTFGAKGNGMRAYRLEADCISMIKQAEAQDKKRYTWYVRTRPDFVWVVPHPPLSLIGLDKLWAFNGESSGGVNGRHLVGHSDLMLKVYSRYQMILNGDPVVFQVNVTDANDDVFMKNILEKVHASLGLMAHPAYLLPNPSWVNTGWRKDGKVYESEQQGALATAQSGACWYKLDSGILDVRRCPVALGEVHRVVHTTQWGISTWMPTIWISMIFALAVALLYAVAVATQWNRLLMVASCLGMAGFYIGITGSLVFTNKFLASKGNFPFPACLITMHMLFCSIVIRIVHCLSPDSFPALQRIEKLDAAEQNKLRGIAVCIAVFQAGTLVMENAALHLGGVAFLQIVKECGMVPLYIFTVLFRQEKASPLGGCLIIMLIIGGSLCVKGELNFVFSSFALQVSSSCVKSLQAVLQGSVLTETSGLKMDAPSYIYKIAPVCLLVMLPLAACEAAFMTTPASIVSHAASIPITILVSCFLALATNLSIAIIIKHINPVGFGILGILKLAIILTCAVVLLREPWTVHQLSGCTIIFVSAPCYALRKCFENSEHKQQKSQEPEQEQPPIHSTMPPEAKCAAADLSECQKS